jgi:CRP-like cAMP-binding protein
MRTNETELVHALKGDPFFAGLTPRWRHELEARMLLRTLRAGDCLFREGELAEGLFMLTAGVVQFTRRVMGRTVAAARQTAPATILTIGLLDGRPNWLSCVAVCECRAYFLDRDAFRHVCGARPALTIQLLEKCCERVRQAMSLFDLLAFASVRQRLAKLIIELSKAAGGNAITLPCTQEQLAVQLGTVREVVFRNLKHLEAESIIRFHRRSVVIEDVARLDAAANAGDGLTPSLPHAGSRQDRLPTSGLPALPAPDSRDRRTAV